MNVALLSLAAFALVASAVSLLIAAAQPGLDRLALQLSPRARTRYWLTLSALPALVAAVAIGAAYLPSLGFGSDHCLEHGPHHPHLCPAHPGSMPGPLLLLLALWPTGRLTRTLLRLLRDLQLNRDTIRALSAASQADAEMQVFAADAPLAFVVGVLRPRVHVSTGLVALGPAIWEPVVAHERAHVRGRDLFWRFVQPLLAVGHPALVGEALRVRLGAAQELAADAAAAASLPGGPGRVAEALVLLARAGRGRLPGISFVGGDLTARVRALLEGPERVSVWPARALVVGALLAPVGIGVGYDPIHHGLETLLGALDRVNPGPSEVHAPHVAAPPPLSR